MSRYQPLDRTRQEREATERRMHRMLWIGLTVPAVACTAVALIVSLDSWLGWLAVLAVTPAAAAGVALVSMVQDRRRPGEEPAP